MSFFKKLTSEIKDLIGDKDEKPKHDVVHGSDSTRDYNQTVQPYQQQNHGAANQYPVPAWSPTQPQLPPGWISQWDQNSQRWYYVEQSSGRTQWDPPQFGYAAAPAHTYDQGYHPQGSYPQPYNNHPQPHDVTSDTHSHDKEKHKSGKGGMIAAGVGGLAVGALAGAALAGDSSDDEHSHAYAGPGGSYVVSAPPTVPLEQNPELSSSQRSSLEEARKDYEEAQREVAEDSDPSSSDVEELQEAREEYHSEVESAHEDLED